MSIQPGIYRIKNRKSGTYFDASVKDRGEIHGWSNRPEEENQKWHVEQSGQGFTIKNAQFGDYASVSGYVDGTRVALSGTPTEWSIEEKDDNTHAICVVGTNQTCDLDMGKKEDGTQISIWGWHGAHQQTWFFERVGDLPAAAASNYQENVAQPAAPAPAPAPVQLYSGAVAAGSYCIENAFSGTAADLAGAGTGEGTPITGWQCNRGSNQTWDLVPAQNGYYFKNAASGTYLGLNGEGAEGTMICGSLKPVEWQVTQADQGYTVHLASNPNVVLDLAGGGSADGVKICLYNNHSGANQQWKFSAPA